MYVGYIYERDTISNNYQKWRCTERRKDILSCSAFAQTYIKDEKHYIKKTKNHNHPADSKNIEIINALNTMKSEAANEKKTSLADIYKKVSSTLNMENLKKLPKSENILQLLEYYRKGEKKNKSNNSKNKKESSKMFHVHEPFVECGAEVEIMTSSRGTKKLNLNGYLFIRQNEKNSVTYWCCEKKKYGFCRGSAITIEKDGKFFLKTSSSHNHLAKLENQKEIAEIIQRIKERSLLSDDSPKVIFTDIIGQLPKEKQKMLPNYKAIVLTIKRHRMKFRPIDQSGIPKPKTYPVEVQEILKRMKDKISRTMEGPAKVYNTEIANLSKDILEKLPKRENVLQMLKLRKRRVKKELNKKFEMMDDYDSDDDYLDSEKEDKFSAFKTLQYSNTKIKKEDNSMKLSDGSSNNINTIIASGAAEILWRFGD